MSSNVTMSVNTSHTFAIVGATCFGTAIGLLATDAMIRTNWFSRCDRRIQDILVGSACAGAVIVGMNIGIWWCGH